MYWVPIAVLAVLLVCAITKLGFLKKEMSSMSKDIGRIRAGKSNERLKVTSRDKHISELANAVNALYDAVSLERADNNRAASELRQSMSNISHDLRTPLTSIIGYVKLMEKESITEQQRRYLSVISVKGESLQRLVNGLFTLTRLEAGEHQFTCERVDARDILSEELAGFFDSLTAGGKEPKIEIGDTPIWVLGDREAISRVFQNLLQNITKHGNEDVRIAADFKNGMAEFAFSNRAENLSLEDLDYLFDRFFTADRMRGKSIGLGLAIVKEFVEQMNGSIGATLDNKVLTITTSWKLVT